MDDEQLLRTAKIVLWHAAVCCSRSMEEEQENGTPQLPSDLCQRPSVRMVPCIEATVLIDFEIRLPHLQPRQDAKTQ